MIPSLEDVLGEARNVLDLARALGRICVDSIADIDRDLRQDRVRELKNTFEVAVRGTELDWWFAADRSANGFAELLNLPSVGPALAPLVGTMPPIEHLALLRGMCEAVLRAAYDRTYGRISLKRGDPVPFAERPTHTALNTTTPHHPTLSVGALLEGTSFRLYGGPTNVAIEVVLDFSDRDNLDAATWHGDHRSGQFPLLATVHPHDEFRSEDDIAELQNESFFGVGPSGWDRDAVLAQLRVAAANDAGIAVFPELSFPSPGALADALEEQHSAYPCLVVGGSAHAEIADSYAPGGTARVNACDVYLNGALLFTHRKIHPFVYRTDEAGEGFIRTEALVHGRRQLTIASGSRTRLGVVICSDLGDLEVPVLLEQAGVNLLLVPALTPSSGAFVGALAQLASRCQTLSLVANGTPPDLSANPLLALSGIPRPEPHEQVVGYKAPSGTRRAIGILDPRTPPLRWL
jgi:hypothetical protein